MADEEVIEVLHVIANDAALKESCELWQDMANGMDCPLRWHIATAGEAKEIVSSYRHVMIDADVGRIRDITDSARGADVVIVGPDWESLANGQVRGASRDTIADASKRMKVRQEILRGEKR